MVNDEICMVSQPHMLSGRMLSSFLLMAGAAVCPWGRYQYNFEELLTDLEKSPDQVNEVIKFIGIAISTTILGLVCRNTIRAIYIRRYQDEDAPEIIKEVEKLRKYSQEFTKGYKQLFVDMQGYFATRKQEIADLKEKEEKYRGL